MFAKDKKTISPVQFRNGICPGIKEIELDGQNIGTIFQRDDRKFWYVSPSFEYYGRLNHIYADTLREVKEAVREILKEEVD